jgi:hypothetical protein
MNSTFILSLIPVSMLFMLHVDKIDTMVSNVSVPAPGARSDLSYSSPAPGHVRKRDIILLEFDCKHKPGRWDIHQYDGEFVYSAGKCRLSMDGSGGMNQHITRRGIMIDPNRPYVIEADFTINEPVDAPAPNSFCINFNIAGKEGELDSLFCWSMNLDISPEGSQHAGVMKTMGFVNGGFREIRSSRKVVDWCRMNTTYHIVIEAGKNADNRFLRNIVVVSVFEGREMKEHFTTDYSSFPYQPDNEMPVRIGLNTHGANWTVRNLKVYYSR